MLERIGNSTQSTQRSLRAPASEKSEDQGGRINLSDAEKTARQAKLRNAEAARFEAKLRRAARDEAADESHVLEQAARHREESAAYRADGRAEARAQRGRRLSARA